MAIDQLTNDAVAEQPQTTKFVRRSSPVSNVMQLSHAPNKPFYTMVNEKHWTVLGGEYLPSAVRYHTQAGSDGATTEDDTPAIVKRQKAGWKFVDESRYLGGIVDVTPVKNGALYHYTWERPAMVGADPVMRRDDELQVKFLRAIRDDYFPDGPPPEVVSKKAAELSFRIRHKRKVSPHETETIKALEDELAVVRGSLAKAKTATKKQTKTADAGE